MVKIYSVPDCPWCKKVKAYLTGKNIAFRDINVEQDVTGKNEFQALSRNLILPLIQIDGKIIEGFDKEKLDEYLGLS